MIDHSAKLLREDNAMDLNYIVLDLPCTFFMLRSLRWAGDACGRWQVGQQRNADSCGCVPSQPCSRSAEGRQPALDGVSI